MTSNERDAVELDGEGVAGTRLPVSSQLFRVEFACVQNRCGGKQKKKKGPGWCAMAARPVERVRMSNSSEAETNEATRERAAGCGLQRPFGPIEAAPARRNSPGAPPREATYPEQASYWM